jgi:chemotaxis protein CheC
MEQSIFTPEQLDYLAEMMNIGAGNAVTALEQILQDRFEMRLPSIHVIEPHMAASVIGDPAGLVTCVKMNLVGDIKGEMFFFVPPEMNEHIGDLAKSSIGMAGEKSKGPDASIVLEIGNILTGVYLTAIHDFSHMNIYHTVPVIATDMAQALWDETLAVLSEESGLLIVIVNPFVSAERAETINTYLVMVPEVDSLKILINSIYESKRLICG